MLQQFDLCPKKESAQLLMMSNSSFISLMAFNNTLKKVANLPEDSHDDITEEMLLKSPPMHIKFTKDNIIIDVQSAGYNV